MSFLLGFMSFALVHLHITSSQGKDYFKTNQEILTINQRKKFDMIPRIFVS